MIMHVKPNPWMAQRFGGLLHRELDALGPCVPGTDGFVRGRRWMSLGEEAPDTPRGLTLSFPEKGKV